MKCKLYIRSGPDTFSLDSVHDLYISALSSGRVFGPGLFTIDTGYRVPSRATQLGEADDAYLKTTRAQKLSNRAKALEQD